MSNENTQRMGDGLNVNQTLEKIFDEIAVEDTQGLIDKSLLLDTEKN